MADRFVKNEYFKFENNDNMENSTQKNKTMCKILIFYKDETIINFYLAQLGSKGIPTITKYPFLYFVAPKGFALA